MEIIDPVETQTGNIERTKRMKEILKEVAAVEGVAWELEVAEVMLAWLHEVRDQDVVEDQGEVDLADKVGMDPLARLILGTPLDLRSSKMRDSRG